MNQVHVAVAVIIKERQVLISLRKPEQHQGNLWEFPGGKVESNESVFEALQREVKEELALDIQTALPLTKVTHDYGDKQVLLDVWEINEFKGLPQGSEGQTIMWCDISALHLQAFPAANDAIIRTIQEQVRDR